MANIGIPLLAIEPSMTWCKLRALHEHRARCGVAVGPAMADKKFVDDAVKAHNEYRKRHQASPLSHNKDLSAHAQRWADHLASTGSFQHSDATLKGEKLGENIAMKWSSSPDAYTGQEVTDQWYSEVKMHQFGGEPRSLSTGHFTQVVWKGSKEVGIGKAVTRDGKVIVVANYRPAGNMVGSFAANVLPPKDGKIILPAETSSKPQASTTHHSFSSEGPGGGGQFSHRFEEMKRGFDAPSSHFSTGGFSSSSTRSESRSVRTYTVTEGVGANKVTKTITEETIIKPDGEKIVNRKETTTSGGAAGKSSADPSSLSGGFGHLALRDSGGKKTEEKKKSKPFWKRSSSSSSDSSPERSGGGKSKDKDHKHKATTTSKPQKMSDFHKDMLKAHNSARAKHGSPALTLAKDLNEHAQQWAEELAAKDQFAHSKCMVKGERVGENIACKWSSEDCNYSGQDAVDQWYSEIKKHNYKSDGAMGSGHFTQVVWKGSKELGVGKAKAAGGKVIVVANYRPAGNMMGTYRDNVFPPV